MCYGKSWSNTYSYKVCKLKISFYVFFMWESEGRKNIFWLLTAAYAGALTVIIYLFGLIAATALNVAILFKNTDRDNIGHMKFSKVGQNLP